MKSIEEEKKRPALARKVTESAGGGKHDEGNVNITEDGKFIGFLDETISSLGKCDLSIGGVLYSLDLQLHTTHHINL